MKNIGIVVIGRNEGKRLVKCFDSVLSANLPIVYVDSQSVDNSIKEAENKNIETIALDLSEPLSAARARNEGFYRLIAKFPLIEFVHFIDADCELDLRWLPEVIETFKKYEHVAVVCGRLREKHRNSTVYMRLCDMDWHREIGFVDSCGGIATYRRDVFEKLTGFDALLIAGEEPELCSRIREIGWKILCIDLEMGTHDSAMVHFSQWWKRCVKVGFGFMGGLEWGGWSKQYKSSLFWGLTLPFLVLLPISSTNGLSLFALILYPIQIYRIFKNKKGDNLTIYDRFIYSFFCVLSKFPEMQGLLTYFVNKALKKNKLIQYK